MGESITVEVCVDSLAGVRAAEAGGAQRIELCAALSEDGVTSSAGFLHVACATTALPVVALIRARGGDFVYTANERDAMSHDLEVARDAGAFGVAVGALRRDDRLDVDAIADWTERARPLAVTVHRAFDRVPDPLDALDELVAIGVDRVLTSGGGTARADGAALRALVDRAAGRLVVLAAGGVRSENARELVEASGVREVHSSARVAGAGADEFEVRALVSAVSL